MKEGFIIAATRMTMFVNILPQRSWIQSVLEDDEPKWKIWSKDQGFFERNSRSSRHDANMYTFLIVLILSLNQKHT